MDDRTAIVTLHRRLGFGLRPGELDQAVARGAAAELERLVDPDANGVANDPDVWAGVSGGDPPEKAKLTLETVVAPWMQLMATTNRPLHEWLRWYWSTHLVAGFDGVREPLILATYLRTLGASGRGSFRDLLKAITIDPAMLRYLNGNRSKAEAPNENYSREVMELFALGTSSGYTEDDVLQGAVALSGWVVDDATAAVTFKPRNGPTGPVPYLGGSVSDVDGVVDALAAHQSCPAHVVARSSKAVFGAELTDADRAGFASAFAAANLDISALIRSYATALLAGNTGGPIVLSPVPWATQAARVIGADVPWADVAKQLTNAGQVPLDPPNVSGWPSGTAWFSTATVVGRVAAASAIATSVPDDSPILAVAAGGDPAEIADALSLPEPPSATTTTSLADVGDARTRLVVLLTSPEMVLA